MTNELILKSKAVIKVLYGLGAADVLLVLTQVAGSVAAKCDNPLKLYDALIDTLLECREHFKKAVADEA
jgi:hypothetical protein